jgi:hypothetical protein
VANSKEDVAKSGVVKLAIPIERSANRVNFIYFIYLFIKANMIL